jgi:hypothetical protein
VRVSKVVNSRVSLVIPAFSGISEKGFEGPTFDALTTISRGSAGNERLLFRRIALAASNAARRVQIHDAGIP